jgi:hypothetical protein
MRSWPIVLFILPLLAGCGTNPAPAAGPPAAGGGPTSAGHSTGTSGATSAGPQCPAGTDVGQTLGITVTHADDPVRNDTSVVCGYGGTRADGGGTGATIRLQTGDAQREYEALKGTAGAQGYPTTDKSGVGDEAFTYSIARANLDFLVARKGEFVVFISAQASFDQEVALANLLISSV